MTAPLQNLCAAVCGDGGAGRVHAPRKMEDAVCKQCAPSVWSSRTQKCGRIERSILVQDKGRWSQAPFQPITPTRKAGRGNGLRAFSGGPHRRPEWKKKFCKPAEIKEFGGAPAGVTSGILAYF